MAKYGALAQQKVDKAIYEMKESRLRTGRGSKKVASRQQAVAIGHSAIRKRSGKDLYAED